MEKNNMKLKAKAGTCIKFIKNKITLEQKNKELKTKIKNRRKINGYKRGTLTSTELNYINYGLNFLQNILDKGFNKKEQQLLLGNKDVSTLETELLNYRNLIEHTLQRINAEGKKEEIIRYNLENLLEDSKITQAARDGTILKEVTRTEKINGKEKEIKYEKSMTDEEAYTTIQDYVNTSLHIY